MRHVYVFDYVTGSIWHTTVDIHESVISVLKSKGLNIKDCEWLETTNPQGIQEI